ncbi:hypothetical protein ACT3TB_16345 [Micrococcaceae sp. AOP34-BR2-30]
MDITAATPIDIDHAIAEIVERWYAVLDKVQEEKRLLRSVMSRRKAIATDIDYRQERIEKFTAEAELINAEREPYDAEFSRRGGWTRFFHVEHLHTSPWCSSFRPTTRIIWLPDYSGHSETEMIAAAGDMVCTKCVPDAPVKLKERPTLPELTTQWDKANAVGACAGSGTSDWKDAKVRTGRYSGNGGYCDHCGKRVGNTSRYSQVIRKHKP